VCVKSNTNSVQDNQLFPSFGEYLDYYLHNNRYVILDSQALSLLIVSYIDGELYFIPFDSLVLLILLYVPFDRRRFLTKCNHENWDFAGKRWSEQPVVENLDLLN